MTDDQIIAALEEVGAAWLMDEADEMCQMNAIRQVVIAARAAERERWKEKVRELILRESAAGYEDFATVQEVLHELLLDAQPTAAQ